MEQNFLDELIPVKYYLEVSSIGLERELRNLEEKISKLQSMLEEKKVSE